MAISQRGQGKVLNNQSGQVILEYVLLLFVAVLAATLITRGLVSRNPESPGVVVGAWSQITNAIGSDIVE